MPRCRQRTLKLFLRGNMFRTFRQLEKRFRWVMLQGDSPLLKLLEYLGGGVVLYIVLRTFNNITIRHLIALIIQCHHRMLSKMNSCIINRVSKALRILRPFVES